MLFCEALTDEGPMREWLCSHIEALGEKPKVTRDIVSVTCEERSEEIIALFEQFRFHTISMSEGG